MLTVKRPKKGVKKSPPVRSPAPVNSATSPPRPRGKAAITKESARPPGGHERNRGGRRPTACANRDIGQEIRKCRAHPWPAGPRPSRPRFPAKDPATAAHCPGARSRRPRGANPPQGHARVRTRIVVGHRQQNRKRST